MKIVKEEEIVSLLLSSQDFDYNKKYRLLSYVMIRTIDQKHVVFNTLTRMIAVLTQEEYDCLKSKEITLNDKVLDLVKNWFLVPIDFNDVSLFNDYSNLIKSFIKKDTSICNYTILPTSDCNARCFYCFEKNVKKLTMTEETANGIINFISKNCNGKKVKFRWFGGEPLYNSKVIDIICDGLLKNGILFSSTMVSNGYLFDDALISKAKNIWNLQYVQITLDGTEKTYNKIKNYIYQDVQSPYSRVLNNIELLTKSNIAVHIRLNMDSYNIEDLKALVRELYVRFYGNPWITVDVHLLFENTAGYKAVRDDVVRDNLAKELFNIKDFLKANNMTNKVRIKRFIKTSCCMADSDDSIVITPDGRLTKCEHHIDTEIIGDIDSGIVNTDLVKTWKQSFKTGVQCDTCVMLPYCITLRKCPEYGKFGKRKHECKITIDDYGDALEREYLSLINEKEDI